MTPSPDAERQRLEGLLSDSLLYEAIDEAIEYEGCCYTPKRSPENLAKVRDVLVSALLAAPHDPAPGLREALTTQVLDELSAVVVNAEFPDGYDWMRDLIVAATRTARPADTPTPDGSAWFGVNAGSAAVVCPCGLICFGSDIVDALKLFEFHTCRTAAPLPPAVAPAPSGSDR